MTTFALSELFDKRAEIAGQIIQLEKQVRQLRADLAHVEAAIRIIRPGTELPKVVPRRVEYRPRFFKRGQLTRLCLDCLREHPGQPVTVSDILPLAIGERDLTARDQEILRTTIHQAMHKLAKRGTIDRLPSQGRIARWRLP